MCLWTRNCSASASCGGDAQPLGGVGGDPQPHLAVVFQVALAQVVDQERQVQQVLLRDRTVDPAQRPGSGPKVRGELDRPQAMLVDRVLVVLVELQQSRGRDGRRE